ncbi:NAD-dependent epimerase [Stenotrophomonas sp. NPDC078853]|uniref:NAD-dependent epimerase n=1 Tax=Stenotrophomonas sp. NPDC078853 TaxID=3364534 RepID=UPI00384C1AB1
MKILVTGAAGFIGFHSSLRLLEAGHEVVGVDNLNDYYDVSLKTARLKLLSGFNSYCSKELDLSNRAAIATLFESMSFDAVLHLGAQAGVRYSIENPFAYIDSNVAGTLTVLEGCRNTGVAHLVYASSSSVYGANKKQPFATSDRTDAPVSLYAATKKSNELMCQTYAHLYRLPITGFRFFTVYGPWGRPDMAYFKFANAIMSEKPIDIYNRGQMERDFTYIDDIVDGLFKAVTSPALSAQDKTPHRVYNLGNHRPEKLLDLVEILEHALGKRAEKNYLPMQPGDVISTFADIGDAAADYGFKPKTSLSQGIERFADWYRDFYQLPK